VHPEEIFSDLPPEPGVHQQYRGRLTDVRRGGSLKTMTVLLRSLLRQGERDWIKLARSVVAGMLDGSVVPVASFIAFRTTLQGAMLEALRPEGRGKYRNWFAEHPEYRILRATLIAILAPLNLPETNHGVAPGKKNKAASG
jgi:hypothetical protein